MANGHGGMRTPAQPAPVSGPGAFSQRTDGGPGDSAPAYMAGEPYGEGQSFLDLQEAAPMGGPKTSKPRGRSGSPSSGAAPAPLFSPTQRPDEPVTAGAPFGPGPGPTPMTRPASPMLQVLQQAAMSDPSPDTLQMLAFAQRLGL